MPSDRLWTRDFLIVSGVNFLLTLVFYMLVVVMGGYAARVFGASLSLAGLVVGIFIIGTLLGRLAIGQLVDAMGRKKTLIIGMVAFTATTCLYFLSNSIPTLVAARFVHGVALGVASTATGAAVAHIIPRARRAEGIGYYSLSTTLAAAVGPFMGLWMLQHADFNWVFVLCLGVALLGLLAAMRLQVPEHAASQGGAGAIGFSLANLLEPKAVPIAVVTLLLSLCYASVLAFINAYAIELKLVTAASFFFIVYSAAVLCSRPLTGRLLDQKGAGIVVYPCCVILAAGLVLLANVHAGAVLLAAGALIGLGYGNLQSSMQALAIKVVEPQRMGLATSTFYIFLDAGLGFGPYLLGLAISQVGYRTLYWVMAVCAVVGMAAFYLLYDRLQRVGR